MLQWFKNSEKMSINLNGEKLYELFFQHGICFLNNIQNILIKLGYTCIQSYLQDEDFQELSLLSKQHLLANSVPI